LLDVIKQNWQFLNDSQLRAICSFEKNFRGNVNQADSQTLPEVKCMNIINSFKMNVEKLNQLKKSIFSNAEYILELENQIASLEDKIIQEEQMVIQQKALIKSSIPLVKAVFKKNNIPYAINESEIKSKLSEAKDTIKNIIKGIK
jgi:hypothetical protein